MVLLVLPLTYANYAVSTPTKVEVQRGGETVFDFQIQGHYSEEDLVCNVDLNQDDFKISLEKDIIVTKGGIKLVEGIIKAPKNMLLREYSYGFCVECLPIRDEGGISTNIRFCNIPLEITVVEPIREHMSPTESIGLGAIIAVILCLGVIYFKLFGIKKKAKKLLRRKLNRKVRKNLKKDLRKKKRRQKRKLYKG